jgi:Skp family chaperone for outer membrane proteins
MFLFSPMKKFRFLIVAAVLMTVALSASAQTKIATVDMKKLFNGYYKTKMAQTALDKKKVDLRKEIKDMADGADKAKADYKQLLDQANDQALSADERDRRRQAASEKLRDINTNQSALDQFERQADSQLNDQSQRMTVNLVADIQKAVGDKAKASGYSIVVNSANPEAVVYANADADITDAVLKQLNAGAPIDVSQPSTSTTTGTSTNTP